MGDERVALRNKPLYNLLNPFTSGSVIGSPNYGASYDLWVEFAAKDRKFAAFIIVVSADF